MLNHVNREYRPRYEQPEIYSKTTGKFPIPQPKSTTLDTWSMLPYRIDFLSTSGWNDDGSRILVPTGHNQA
jgi:hypothetical protein